MTNNSFQPDDESLSAYIDGQLSAGELRDVEEWLERDPAARAMVDELRNVSSMVQSLPRETVPESWKAELAGRLDKATTSSSKSGGGMPTIPIGRSSRGWWYSGAAIAASVAIVCYTQFLQPMAPRDVALKAPAAGAEIGENTLDGLDADTNADLGIVMEAEVEESAPEVATLDDLASAPEPSSAVIESRPVAPPMAAAVPAADSDGESPTFTPMTNIGNNYLIVWADVPPEALREQQINRVLEDNGIAVEQSTVDWVMAAEPVRQQIELRSSLDRNLNEEASRASSFGGLGGRTSPGISSRFSVPDRAGEARDEANASSNRSREALAQPRGGIAIEGETILVEASADQIAACLAEMEQDTGNYTAVTVEPVQPEVVAEQLATLQRSQATDEVAKNLADVEQLPELQQDTEGRVVDERQFQQQAAQPVFAGGGEQVEGAQAKTQPRARRLARPNQWYYYNTAPQDSSNTYQLRTATGKLSKSGIANKATKASDGKAEQLGNINRLLSQQNARKPSDQPVIGEDQQVHVLFVLRNSYLPEASGLVPAAEIAPSESP